MIAEGIRHPGIGLIRIIFYDEKAATGFQTAARLFDESVLVFYIMQGIRHQDTIQVLQGQIVRNKIQLQGFYCHAVATRHTTGSLSTAYTTLPGCNSAASAREKSPEPQPRSAQERLPGSPIPSYRINSMASFNSIR